MFEPFTGLSAGKPDEIRNEFNSIRDRGASHANKALRESISDSESLWKQPFAPEDWVRRFDAAFKALDVRPINEYLPTLRKALLRSVFRKWFDSRCDTVWTPVIDHLRQSIAPAPQVDNVQQLIERVKKDEIGVYHILFPTALEEHVDAYGSIASIIVRVIPRLDEKEAVLSLAPWSFFDWVDEDNIDSTSENNHLRTVLSGALKNAGWIDLEVDRWHFVFELSPAGGASCPWGLSADAEKCLNDFLPNSLLIKGDSLELSVAIAAWAAHSQLSVPMLVATGQLKPDGSVANVGGIAPKLRAIKRLQGAVKELKIKFPIGIRNEVRDALGGDQLPDDCFVRSLSDLFKSRLLTDGFDAYRAACDSELPIPAEKSFSGQKPEPVDPKSPQSRLITSAWYRDFSVTEPEVTVIPSFFASNDESPEKAAQSLAKQAMHPILREKPGDKGKFPVAIAVSMESLINRNWKNVLAESIDHAIDHAIEQGAKLANRKDTNGNRLRETTDPEAMAIALRKPGKLVLIVYDDLSIALWNRLGKEAAFKGYEEGIERLKSVVTQNKKRGTNWADQQIVAICSDYRHALMWDPEFERSRELESAKS